MSTAAPEGKPSQSATAAQPSPHAMHHRLSDPLLACLHTITKLYQRPVSEQALKAGLPLVNHKLTPALFVRAAEHAGFKAQIIKRSLDKIKPLALPIVLLLKDNQACVLTKKHGEETADIMEPDLEDSTTTVDMADLEESYSGYAILVRPAYQFTERSEELVETEPKHWFWGTLVKAWPFYGEVVLASFLINCFGIAIPLFAMNVYDRVVPNHAVETLWVLASGVAIVFVFEFVMRTLRAYLIDIAGKKVDLKLSAKIFAQALGLKMGVRPASVGVFASTIQNYEFFRDFITSSTIALLADLPFVFLYIAIVFLIAGNMALIPLVMVPIAILVGALVQLPLQQLIEESSKHSAEKQATLIESLHGIETIKSEGAESRAQTRWERTMALLARTGVKLRLISNFSSNFSVFLQELTSILVVIIGVYQIVDGKLTMGGLIACSILAGRALGPVPQLASLVTRYSQSMQAMQALDKIMELPVERPADKVGLQRPNLMGSVEFHNAKFQYPNQKTLALDDVSFTIRAGERVGILGRIGSGKTTITKLILGLYHPTEGHVLIGDTELQQIDSADLRHKIGYVPQDTMLFYGSVRDNIALAMPWVNDAAILRAATVAGVDQFVSHHPDGYDWQVGERGAYLSGGQRRCIAIARALLGDPQILLLDEPSNDMDEITENQLKANLVQYLPERTLILMTHKLSLLSLVDRLIILENGRIVADGPKQQVLQAIASKAKPPQATGG
jgi:ATP-binding cassette subfamily C protein LapB